MHQNVWIPLLLLITSFCANSFSGKIEDINNFSLISNTLASAGMPSDDEFKAIKEKGYKHIITLIPGDQSDEKQLVNSLGLTFDQVSVVWRNPTLNDFQNFLSLMENYDSDKVFLHCAMNYRASAFAYLYQVIQQKEDKMSAKRRLHTI